MTDRIRNYADALSEGLMCYHALQGNPLVAEEEVSLHMVQGRFTLKYKGRTMLAIEELADSPGQCIQHRDDAVMATIPLRHDHPADPSLPYLR